MAIVPTRLSTPNTMGSSLCSSPDPIELKYPIIRDNISVLYDHLTSEEVEQVYVELEKKGIITVDGIALMDDRVLEAAGIPLHLVSLFREECRCEELIAEGFGVSAPWEWEFILSDNLYYHCTTFSNPNFPELTVFCLMSSSLWGCIHEVFLIRVQSHSRSICQDYCQNQIEKRLASRTCLVLDFGLHIVDSVRGSNILLSETQFGRVAIWPVTFSCLYATHCTGWAFCSPLLLTGHRYSPFFSALFFLPSYRSYWYLCLYRIFPSAAMELNLVVGHQDWRGMLENVWYK